MMSGLYLFLFSPFLLGSPADDGLSHQWQFLADKIEAQQVKASKGTLDATIVGPVQFNKEPPYTLLLAGNSQKKQCIHITDDLSKADLPRKDISVEAWVRVDQPQKWGGIIGAFQHNGSYQKGWLLGYQDSQFSFAVASKSKKQLTYLKGKHYFQTGYWYHVVGTYDGQKQCLYVDGKLQATSLDQRGEIDYPPRGSFTIAAYRDDDEHFSLAGQLEQISLFHRVLTSAEIADRFRLHKDRFPDMDPVRPRVVDWPTYLHDNLRLGETDQVLPVPLHLHWVHKTRFAPQPAWPEEAKNDYFHNRYDLPERVIYDRAFHLVGVGNHIYLASSADNQVHCLDADTGREKWSFWTEGPIRLAPTVVQDRVLVASDDSCVYCVQAKDGSLLWKKCIAPEPRRIPGNGRIISAWPIRSSILVEDFKAYVCAGIFSHQGVFQSVLDIRDGNVLEQQPLKASAQGYLERQAGKLFIATGRKPEGTLSVDLQRQGKDFSKEAIPNPKGYPYSLIAAGNVYFAGGDGKLAAFDRKENKLLWFTTLQGKVYSLAIVGQRLLASTDLGVVYCFGQEARKVNEAYPPKPVSPVYPDAVPVTKVARAIVQETGKNPGYCLVLGSGEGYLAIELAKQTPWQIIGVENAEAMVDQSRRLIGAAGLADRVTIHQGSLEKLPYTDYLFNVVVADNVLSREPSKIKREEILRVLRPGGGLAVFSLAENGMIRRPALEGAGEWTHFYGNPANTACSGDRLVGAKLQLQWFGRPGPRNLIDRHHRTVAPLCQDGRLVVAGEEGIAVVDAYNGMILWEKALPRTRRIAAFRDCGNMALAHDSLFVATADQCLALDAQTGAEQRTYTLPGNKDTQGMDWGYLATDGGLLIGSGVRENSSRRQQSRLLTLTETHWDFVPVVFSNFLFAYNHKDGKLAWTYRSPTGPIINPSITIAQGRIHFLQSHNLALLEKSPGRARLADLLEKGSELITLDLHTGQKLWSTTGQPFARLQHNIFMSCAEEILTVVGSRNSGPDRKKDRVVYDLHGLDAREGKLLWSQTQVQGDPINGEHGEQERHPVLFQGKIYCEPRAYDLYTGKPAIWNWPWIAKNRRGCGTLSASASCFFFRNSNPTLFEVATNQVQSLTGDTRPGCWINMIPASGLLLVPEASSGCTCDYPIQSSLAFIPVPGSSGK